MRIIGYLKQSKVAVALIVVLLIVQAFADLSLPRYTSDLVDVGIQQGGIEDCSPSVMSSDTFNYTCMLAFDDDEQLLRSSYEQDSGGNFTLTKQGTEQRKELDSAIALPLVVVHFSARRRLASIRWGFRCLGGFRSAQAVCRISGGSH